MTSILIGKVVIKTTICNLCHERKTGPDLKRQPSALHDSSDNLLSANELFSVSQTT